MWRKFINWLKSLFTSNIPIAQDYQEKPQYIHPIRLRQRKLQKDQRVINVLKHIKLANACKNPYERQVHIRKAEKLINRYHFPALQISNK